MSCPADNELVEEQIDRILTQYRESPNLLFLLRTYLRQIEIVYQGVCELPEKFDIETAVGDQLTLIGKRIGWPRCHCVCYAKPVFGFKCGTYPTSYPITGFCDTNSTWKDCDEAGLQTVCLEDDEVYRTFLKVRCYQMLAKFDRASLLVCIRMFFGDTAVILSAKNGRIVIAPGRALTNEEANIVQLYPRVLPVQPSIDIRFHFGALPVFGFGEGWEGFCEPLYPDGAFLVDEDGNFLVDESDNFIRTGQITRSGVWMCATDVHAYDCAN